MSRAELKKFDLLLTKEISNSKQKINDTDTQMLKAAFTHMIHSNETSLPFVDQSLFDIYKKFIGQRKNYNRQSDDFLVREGNKGYTHSLLHFMTGVPYPAPKSYDFRFIDLFSGIGGFRLAFQEAGGKPFFSSEWDKFAQQTYFANFGEIPYGDIRKIKENEIPDHDILCAGFPCQPFSLAGVSKKNSLGKKHGFEDETQGTLFFDIKRIINKKRPKAFMLENVKNLTSHDKGKTFQIIMRTLKEELGYVVNWKIVDGSAWVPQHRERIFIVGYDPEQVNISKEEIIIPEKPNDGHEYMELKNIIKKDVRDHTLGVGTWESLKRHKAHHKKAGNGFGYGLINMPVKDGQKTRTISARYHKDGAEILIEQKGDRPRKLTIKEAMQLQGYDPDKYIFPVSKTQAYKQIGNSVVVPAVAACAREMAKMLKERSL